MPLTRPEPKDRMVRRPMAAWDRSCQVAAVTHINTAGRVSWVQGKWRMG